VPRGGVALLSISNNLHCVRDVAGPIDDSMSVMVKRGKAQGVRIIAYFKRSG
jgi:hypothetical protein